MARDLNIALIMKLVNQVSGPARTVQRDLQQIDQATGQLSRRQELALGAARAASRAMMIGATAAMTAVGGSIAQAATMEDAWSDANKTLELAPQELANMKTAIDDLAVEIPVARKGLVDIAATAGQLGIRGSADILAFTEDAAKMSSTFDVAEGQAAEMMGSWREQMGYGQDEVRLLADQINYLGNTTAAESANVAEYYTRVASIADVAGLTQEETLAIGAGMIAMGRGADVASTGLQATLRTMTKGLDDMSAAQRGVVDTLGLKGQWSDLQAQMQTDASGAMRTVVDAISQLDPEKRAAAASRLFGEEAGRAMGSLLSDVDALDRVLERMPQIAAAAGSMEAEYLALSDDVLDNLKRVKNALGARTGALGATFLDPINDGLKGFLGYLGTVDQRADVFERVSMGAKGFMSALEFPGAGRAKSVIDGLWGSVSRFVLGDLGADAGEVLASMFYKGQEAGQSLANALTAIDERLAPLKDAGFANLSKIGNLVTDIATPIAAAFGPGGIAREALGWLASVSFDVGVAAWTGYQNVVGSVLDELIAFGDWIGDKAGAIDLNIFGDMPDLSVVQPVVDLITALTGAVASLISLGGTSLRALMGGMFDGFAPHLEGIANRLGPISERVGRIISAVAETLSNIAEALGWVKESESAMGALERVGQVLGDTLGGLASLALDGIDLALGAIEWIVTLIKNLSGGDLGSSFAPLQDFFDWLSGLTFSSMLPDIDAASVMAEIASWFTFDWVDVLPDWDWGAIVPEMPDFKGWFSWGDDPEVEDAKAVIEVTKSIADVAAETAAVEQLQGKIESTVAQAQGLPPLVEEILAGTRSIALVDLSLEGVRIMESFAAGIRSGTAQVVAAIAEMTAQMNAALPQGGMVQLAVAGGAPMPIEGRRDAGGPMRAGLAYLTGERGPEIIVPDSAARVIPEWAMRSPVQRPRPTGQIARATTAGRSTRIDVGQIVIRAASGMDPHAIAAEVRRQLQDIGRTDDDLFDDEEF